jgi:hypothetical protein
MNNDKRLKNLANSHRYNNYTRRLLNGTYARNKLQYTKNLKNIASMGINVLDGDPTTNNSYQIASNLNFLSQKIIATRKNKNALLANITRSNRKPLRKVPRNWIRNLKQRTLVQGTLSMPTEIKKTLDDGDCFYSSIYRAAEERPNLLERISIFLDLPTESPTEAEFITKFREKVAEKLLMDAPESELYDRLKTVSSEDPETYALMMEQYPRWFVNEFGKKGKNLGTKDQFYKKLIKHITKRGTWVGHLEVEQVQDMLSSINIRIYILRTMAYELPMREGVVDILWLYNDGEAHYEYFSFYEDSNNSSENT